MKLSSVSGVGIDVNSVKIKVWSSGSKAHTLVSEVMGISRWTSLIVELD